MKNEKTTATATTTTTASENASGTTANARIKLLRACNKTGGEFVLIVHDDGSIKYEGTEELVPTFSALDSVSPYIKVKGKTFSVYNASESEKTAMRAHNALHGKKRGLGTNGVTWRKAEYYTADGYILSMLNSLDDLKKSTEPQDALRLNALTQVARAMSAEKPLEKLAELRKSAEKAEEERKASERLTANAKELAEGLKTASTERKATELRALVTALGLSADELSALLAPSDKAND